MSTEFIDIDFNEMIRNSEKLYEEYRKIESDLKNDIAQRVLNNAGDIFLKEQRRILQQRYPDSKIAPLLAVWVKKVKGGWRLYVGVPDTVTKEQAILAMVTEFGRPGRRSMKNGGKDVLGRKIGKVEPYSYVRASKFIKGEEVMKEIDREIAEELKRRWNG